MTPIIYRPFGELAVHTFPSKLIYKPPLREKPVTAAWASPMAEPEASNRKRKHPGPANDISREVGADESGQGIRKDKDTWSICNPDD